MSTNAARYHVATELKSNTPHTFVVTDDSGSVRPVLGPFDSRNSAVAAFDKELFSKYVDDFSGLEGCSCTMRLVPSGNMGEGLLNSLMQLDKQELLLKNPADLMHSNVLRELVGEQPKGTYRANVQNANEYNFFVGTAKEIAYLCSDRYDFCPKKDPVVVSGAHAYIDTKNAQVVKIYGLSDVVAKEFSREFAIAQKLNPRAIESSIAPSPER